MISGPTFRPAALAARLCRKVLALAASVVLVLVLAAPAEARRLALVVGNAAYQHIPGLDNAVADARDMAEALRRLGFEVTLLTDVGSDTFWVMLDSFSRQTETAETALFFYSGHAFQIDGVNHLVPVSARLSDPEMLGAETWNLDGIVSRLQSRNSQTLIFLDACRDNPLPEGLRGPATGADGLAQFPTRAGTFVAFATEPGAVSYDGAGQGNSPFSRALLAHMEVPGQSISDLMIRVRNDVEAATGGRQTPWDQSSLRAQFYFNPEAAAEPGATGLPEFDLAEDITEIGAPSHGRPAPIERMRLDPVAEAGATGNGPAVVTALPAPAAAPIQRIEALPGPEAMRLAALGSGTRSIPAMRGLDAGADARVRITGTDALPAVPPVVAVAPEPEPEPEARPEAASPGTAPADDRLAALDPADTPAAPPPAGPAPALEGLPAALAPAEEEEPELEGRDLAHAIQSELQRMGCYRMRIDGIWGNGSRNALRGYYGEKGGGTGELEPSMTLLRRLKDETEVTCPAPRVAAPVRTQPQQGSGQRATGSQQRRQGAQRQQQQQQQPATTTRQRECTFLVLAIVCK